MNHCILVAKNLFGIEYLMNLKKLYKYLHQQDLIVFDKSRAIYPRLKMSDKRGEAGFKELKKLLPAKYTDNLIIQVASIPEGVFDDAFDKIKPNYPCLSPSPIWLNNTKNIDCIKYIKVSQERNSWINNHILNYYNQSKIVNINYDEKKITSIKSMIDFYTLSEEEKINIVKYILNK